MLRVVMYTDLCMEMCIEMCMEMRIDMCIEMCIEIITHEDISTHKRCMGMHSDTGTDRRIEFGYRHVCRRDVYRRVYRQV